MGLKVTLIADSCFLFDWKGIRILTDPWIGTSIYGGAWLQFPVPKIKPEEVGPLDYIFISHIHEDHCCPETISKLDKNATVIIMKKNPNYVEKFLKYHDFKFKDIINLNPRERFQVNQELSFEVVEADPEHSLNFLLDSSLLIHYENKSLYFANDNPPYKSIYPYISQFNFELAIVPPAGGSGYPAFYSNLSTENKRQKAQDILNTYQHSMLDCLRAISPKFFLCSANSHVLSGSNWRKNYEMAWPDNGNAPYIFLKSFQTEQDHAQPLLLQPGMQVDLSESPGKSFDEAIRFYDNKSERDAFLEKIASQNKYCYESLSLTPSINLEYLFELAHRRLVHHLERNQIDLPWCYQFNLRHNRIATIELAPPYNINFETPLKASNRLLITVDDRLLYLLLTGGFSWNIADASGFIEYSRIPDEYIYDMYIYLNHLRI